MSTSSCLAPPPRQHSACALVSPLQGRRQEREHGGGCGFVPPPQEGRQEREHGGCALVPPPQRGGLEGGSDYLNLIQQCRDKLLATQDTVCLERARLVTEAYREYAQDPPPLRRAKAFAHVLRHMTLDLDMNPVFAGNTSSRPRAWMLVPEHGMTPAPQVVLENESLKGLLDDQIPPDLQDFWADRSFGGNSGIGHLAVDLNFVVYTGLDALLVEAQAGGHDLTADQRIYRQAMAIALQAVIDWAQRYADAAEAAAQETDDPVIRAAHLRVAAACRHVPAQPARTLFEALQAIVLVHLAIVIEGHGMSVSIGLPDRVLAPFIDVDFDPAEATELLMAFMLKITANSIFGRGSKTQAITVGGLNYRGEDQCNLLTLCFLEACDRLRVGDPHVFLRWHADIDPHVKRRALAMLAGGVSMPLLIHDGPTAQGFINAGVSVEDAWDYCVIGCNELGIPGRSAESATATSGTIQYLELLNETLFSHPDLTSIKSVDQLLDALEATMAAKVRAMWTRGRKQRARRAAQVPTPFTSALMHGCIEKGQDMAGGMPYHLPGLYERGLTNAVNALAAIQEAVFEDKIVTLPALVEMLDEFSNLDTLDEVSDQRPPPAAVRDLAEQSLRTLDKVSDRCPAYATLRARLLAAPKWGNDDARADRWARELLAMRERVLADAISTASPVVCHVVRSLHYLDGRRIGASPDGRLAWTPVAASVGAQAGTAKAGPTAMLNSVLKLDAARYYRGGYNLNLTLPYAKWHQPEMQSDLLALVETFFVQGGQELQIASLDAARLRDAQAHPERHADLLVRVAGFNTRFVDLSRMEQDELIRRAEGI